MNFEQIITTLREAGKTYEEIAEDIADSFNKAKEKEVEKKEKEKNYNKKLNHRKADLLGDIANKRDTLDTYAELGAIAVALEIKDKKKLDERAYNNMKSTFKQAFVTYANVIKDNWDFVWHIKHW